MPRANKLCSRCPTVVSRGVGMCSECKRKAEQARGSSHARGYDQVHQATFREGVLARHPLCQADGCTERSTDADHWPLSRRELVDLGLDPNDPQHGRGLCHSHHSQETAKHQPGGWNATRP